MRRSRKLQPSELRIDLSQEDVLEDLCWPGPPPGRWNLPPRHDRATAHVDALLAAIERSLWP